MTYRYGSEMLQTLNGGECQYCRAMPMGDGVPLAKINLS